MNDNAATFETSVGEPRERLAAWAAERGFDWLVLAGDPWVFWLTGYHRYGAGAGAAAVSPTGEVRLWVSHHEVAAATRATADVSVCDYTSLGFGLLDDPFAAMAPTLEASLGAGRVAQVGAPWLGRAVDVASDIDALRMVKGSREVREIARRVALVWSAQSAIADALEHGASEIELFSLARATAEGLWGGPVEMVADVIGGPATSDVAAPVAVAGAREVRPGEALIADLVLGAGGYFSDVTWTHLHGTNDALVSRRDHVLGVLDRVAAGLVPGRAASDVFTEMAERLASIGPSRGLVHHAGHGIGLSGYEPPFLAPFDETPLAAGMVVALEPGFYDELGGVRVECDYVVTPDGGVELPGRPARFGGSRG